MIAKEEISYYQYFLFDLLSGLVADFAISGLALVFFEFRCVCLVNVGSLNFWGI